eukprot:TRINITY_DN1175_c0_g1_i10.p3 TRINITY_DN1175_c0_g1~~TRINITY_DN1175_c0_g1_i10.p3  ORF type:complete len:144 (+),score=7.94 TRINITY_DN1175_c0_g1_i10:654-1085(+)
MFEFSDRSTIGIGLTGLGVLFTFLGVLFLFDKPLLALGNLMFLSGVGTIIGPLSTLNFFFPEHDRLSKWQATLCFFGGILLILKGWTFIGLFIELYGVVRLFGAIFPQVLSVLRNLPIVGSIFRAPWLKRMASQAAGKSPLPS